MLIVDADYGTRGAAVSAAQILRPVGVVCWVEAESAGEPAHSP